MVAMPLRQAPARGKARVTYGIKLDTVGSAVLPSATMGHSEPMNYA